MQGDSDERVRRYANRMSRP